MTIAKKQQKEKLKRRYEKYKLEKRQKEQEINQRKFKEEREKQEAAIMYNDRRITKRYIQKARDEIQEEFNLSLITNEYKKITQSDLVTIKRLLISFDKSIEDLQSNQFKMQEMLFEKEREIRSLKKAIKKLEK